MAWDKILEFLKAGPTNVILGVFVACGIALWMLPSLQTEYRLALVLTFWFCGVLLAWSGIAAAIKWNRGRKARKAERDLQSARAALFSSLSPNEKQILRRLLFELKVTTEVNQLGEFERLLDSNVLEVEGFTSWYARVGSFGGRDQELAHLTLTQWAYEELRTRGAKYGVV